MSVLIVEDEWILADAMANDVAAWGFEVVGPVGSVKSALTILETEHVTAAILDVSLGGASTSFPIAKALRARNIPFCFMTGYIRGQLPDEFRDAALFVKPCEGVVLREHMQTWIQPHRHTADSGDRANASI